MPVHVMLDLETVGTQPGCALFSIGAVRFDPTDVRRGLRDAQNFEVGLNLKGQERLGLKVDMDTLEWWLDEKRLPGLKVWQSLHKVDIFAGLTGFADWLGESELDGIWSNGSNFDLPILQAAYEGAGLDVPWSYKQERCYRTLAALRTDIKRDYSGTEHDALVDARNQAYHLQQIISATRTVL